METTSTTPDLKEKILHLFEKNKETILKDNSPGMIEQRTKAIQSFKTAGFPTIKTEKWRETDLSKMLATDYSFYFEPTFRPGIDLSGIFQCNIPHLDTNMVPQLNGWFVSDNSPVKTTPEGVIVGSYHAVKKYFPDLFNQYAGKIADITKSSMVALNTAFATDGTFIYVPDNVHVQLPMHMVNIIKHDRSIFIQNRNLVVLGRNARLQLVQCDDSVDQQQSFTNSVTEIFIGQNAFLDHYKLQNKNNSSTFINTSFFSLERDARLNTNGITLNGGLIRNETYVTLNGENSEANIMGAYLMDRTQHVDNHVFVDHKYPNCISNELFKGILDDSASAVFNGHILVRRDAQKTNAYQNNKNILLTDKAIVYTKPFLEIYADDVKCSHGATIGQLDQNAMFYLKSRGIGEKNARLLLMYAFAAEIVNHISIEPLKIRIDDMVKKRLRGELSICDKCVLHCSAMDNPIQFDIDLSKI